jgi:hypothetical protein
MGKSIFTLFMCGLNIESRLHEEANRIQTFISEN